MAIKDWSTLPANNNSAAPNGWPEGMPANAVNDTGRQMMADVRSWYEEAQWIDFDHIPTFTSSTTFSIAGDVTVTYTRGRRIRCTDATTLYGQITNSSYGAPNTTVTVALDSGSLSVSLSAVAVAALTAANSSVPVETGGGLAMGSDGLRLGSLTGATRGDLYAHSGTDLARMPAGADEWVLSALASQVSGLIYRDRRYDENYFILSNNATDSLKDIDIGAGSKRDGTGTRMITLASGLTKQLDATWAVGTNAGGLQSGVTLTADTWYHGFAILRSDTGVVDAIFSNSIFAPTLPTNYDFSRYIGSVLMDGANNVKAFFQYGPVFWWDISNADLATASMTNPTTVTLSVPPKELLVFGSGTTSNSGGTGGSLGLRHPSWTSILPSVSGGPGLHIGGGSAGVIQGNFWVAQCDSSGQVEVNSNYITGTNTAYVTALGWLDLDL